MLPCLAADHDESSTGRTLLWTAEVLRDWEVPAVRRCLAHGSSGLPAGLYWLPVQRFRRRIRPGQAGCPGGSRGRIGAPAARRQACERRPPDRERPRPRPSREATAVGLRVSERVRQIASVALGTAATAQGSRAIGHQASYRPASLIRAEHRAGVGRPARIQRDFRRSKSSQAGRRSCRNHWKSSRGWASAPGLGRPNLGPEKQEFSQAWHGVAV